MTQTNSHMQGKVCLVTGATSGIGEVTARALAQMGATVIVVGRDAQRGAATLERIKKAAPTAQVEFMLADLSSQAQVRQLAQEFKLKYSRLDVLVNNAGAWLTRHQESVDRIEMTFALNHLGYFLLTNLLLETLKTSAPARIINVSSYGHEAGRMNFDDLQFQHRYNGMQAYRQSKLANILFTYELARQLTGTGVTVNVLNPGLVATNFGLNNFGLNNRWLKSLLRRVYALAAISPEQGAQTAIYLAVSPEVKSVTGKYFMKEKGAQSSPASYDIAAASRLWQLSQALTKINKEN
ncbi:MAG: short-chain dehydrogenase [Chloroflexi bacterium GWB2_49_20]|nr:MAG: short-chain dehydrogenase [Chloroflexi bacterium GWB2_49_20]OGN79346.1 MAG: short-chain dehydrogenase [Chloroflexi bacterium GWC2_49_37]OGN82884.1 MAG: short-chain dehydrogenase [Chloroflexi bacterium GWD2_49_16]HCC78536.1 short-chain dehydrogenase [Anaerolineae bacterium]